MSSQVTDNFSQQYSANVYYLSQQKGSRLRPTVRNERQKGKRAFYDRIGTVAAIQKVGRHSSTPQLDTPHSRRAVDLTDYEWADLVDDQDKIRMLHDPTSEYAIAAMWAMGRSMDDITIAALGAAAITGETGSSTASLGTANQYAANDGTVVSDLNLKTLRAVKRMLDSAEVDPSIKRYFVCSAKQIESLLGQTQVTSADYNSVKALVQGELNTFMGFEFVRSERLGTSSAGLSGSGSTGAIGSGTSLDGTRVAYAYCQSSAILSIGEDVQGKISERPDKSYSTQVYYRMSMGAVRMEEATVVQVFCTES